MHARSLMQRTPCWALARNTCQCPPKAGAGSCARPSRPASPESKRWNHYCLLALADCRTLLRFAPPAKVWPSLPLADGPGQRPSIVLNHAVWRGDPTDSQRVHAAVWAGYTGLRITTAHAPPSACRHRDIARLSWHSNAVDDRPGMVRALCGDEMIDRWLLGPRQETARLHVYFSVREGFPFDLAQVFGPGFDNKGLQVATGLRRIAEQTPAHRPIATAESPKLSHRHHEVVCSVDVDQVFRNHHDRSFP